MNHEMRLLSEPFDLIQSGKKTVEIRLNDEKRQKICLGDTITFTCLPDAERSIKVRVIGLLWYTTFEDFFTDLPFVLFGRDDWSHDDMLLGVHRFWTQEKIEKYGPLGIKFKVIHAHNSPT